MFSQFRFAARSLARWRGGAVVAVLTLAVGIGTTTGIYAFVHGALGSLLDFPGVPELATVGRVYASSRELGVERSPVALNEFQSTLAGATSFAAIGVYADEAATLGTGANVRQVIAGYASPGFFIAMGVPPLEGRVITPTDLQSAQPVVVLSHALWRREFPGGGVGNATVVVDGVTRLVVGVMPPEFQYPFVGIGADLWVPLAGPARGVPAIVAVYARLREGVGWPAAQAELAARSRGHAPWTWRAIPVEDDTRYRATAAYAFTLGPAALILLIACVNVACMLLARGIERDKELSVRRALGATRGRVIRLLLLENLVLALISGTLGSGLAALILRALASAFAGIQPGLAGRIAVDFRLLPAAVVTSAAACLLFGTAPALRLSRRDVAAALNGVSPAHRVEIAGYGGRDLIVFVEIAAAVGLIVWTAMLYTLFAQVRLIRFGFPADRIVAMRVPAAGAPDVALRVAGVPGVTRVARSSGLLGGGAPVRVDGNGHSLVMSRVPAGEGFLETLGIPLIRGRWFTADELRGGSDVAILGESGARRLSPDGDALNTYVTLSGRNRVLVIGICADAIDYGTLATAEAFAPSDVYVPDAGSSNEAVILARMSNDPHASLRAIAAAAQATAGTRPPRPIVLSDEMNQRRIGVDGIVMIRLLAVFALLTLLLAASGVFAVLSQSVAQRTREFGIRMAIGATADRVLRMVLVRETKLIGLAVGVGLVFTMVLTRALFVELTRLSAVVPSIWIGALLLSAGVAALALAFATYRIVRLEPAAVLRRH